MSEANNSCALHGASGYESACPYLACVQRQEVRSILARTPSVADWTGALAEAGG